MRRVLLDPVSFGCPVCGTDVTGLVREVLEERVDVGYWRMPGSGGSAWQEFEVPVDCPGPVRTAAGGDGNGHRLTVVGKFIA